MKIIYRFFIFVLLFSAIAVAQKHPNELKKTKDINFEPQKPIEFVLSNGIKVFFLENKELPLISCSALIKAGSLYEPKNGVCVLMGTVLRTGGTKSKTGDKIDEELEFLSASIECGIGSEYANISSECLKKDFKTVVNTFADIIINPEFRQEKIDLAKNQTKEAIKRRFDQPDRIAAEFFSEKVYGSNTPYGSRIKVSDLNVITREDMINYHAKYFLPNNTYLSVTGDISQQELKNLLEEAFQNWKRKDIQFPEIAALEEKADGTIYYIKKDAPQANIAIGHLGVKRNNPDQYKIELLNNIFGGGFTSRLNKELRSNRGLTYGIRGGVTSGKDKGTFMVASQLKAEKCIEALKLIKDIVKEMQTGLVTDEEIDQAKNSIINSFVFRFEQKDKYLGSYVNMKLNDYPDDYYAKYLENIKKVTKEDIREAAKKYMNPDKMIMIIVGNQDKFDKPLNSIGTVTEIDLKKIIADETAEK
jgi:predicted Zn-dependent peptidase